MPPPGASAEDACIEVRDLDMMYGERVIQKNLAFTVRRGDIFIIMGGSGCGKSTLLRHLIGLIRPARGDVLYDGQSFWGAEPEAREHMLRRFGVLYQGGALWSSMTLAENVALPLEQYTSLAPSEIRDRVSLKLALVGLAGFEEFYPSEISGGMCKRAGLARAMALDPDILFFDEPSAGLDPISSRLLDDLILEATQALVRRLDTETVPAMNETLRDAQRLVQRLDSQTLTAVNETVKDAQRLVQRVDGETVPAFTQFVTGLGPVIVQVEKTVAVAREALAQAQTTLATVDGGIGEASPLQYQLQTTLQEVAGAARALRVLSNYLERNPDALIFGKNGR